MRWERRRGPDGGSGRSVRTVGVGLAALAAVLLVAPRARAASPIPIELEENIDEACTARSIVERLDESGVATVRVAHGGTVVLTIDVRKDGSEFDGVLTIRQGLTPTETRSARSSSCDEVLDALATIASIALVEMEPAPPSGASEDDARPRKPALPVTPAARSRRNAFKLRVGTGVELSLVGDGRGSLAIPFALRLEQAQMPTLRLAVLTRRTGRIVTDGSAGEIDVHLGRLEVGPQFAVARRLSLQVAWSSEVGILSGRLTTDETIQRAWWASGVSLYARVDGGWGDLGLGMGAVLPILRPRFHRHGDPPLFEVPVVVPWIGLFGGLSIF